MLEYEVKELSEKELEAKISEHPHLIEVGLRLVANQRKTGRGPLDILFVDAGNALVVTELKIAKDDDMLLQALDYYDYVYSNLAGLALAFEVKGFKIDQYQDPRILLVAPDFSLLLINRCKWLDVRIDLYRYRCLTVKKEGKEVGELIDFLPVEIPTIPKREEVYTESKVLDYITVPQLKQTATEFLTEIQKWEDVKIDPVQSAISIKIKKDVFIYLYPKRAGFQIAGYLSEHEWQQLKVVESPDDLKDALFKAKQAYDNIRQK